MSKIVKTNNLAHLIIHKGCVQKLKNNSKPITKTYGWNNLFGCLGALTMIKEFDALSKMKSQHITINSMHRIETYITIFIFN